MKRDPAKLTDRAFDLLVIGGGISGACVARDAALRGLRVALVDRGDFGAATSANSLRIVHGGLRYLQQLNLPRMRRSILERSIWLRNAPHLVHPLGFMAATSGRGMRSRTAMRAALRINDLVGFDRNRDLDPSHAVPEGRIVDREEARAMYPGVDADRITGGAVWYDAQIRHSERLVLAAVLDAHAAGAEPVNYVEITRLSVDGRRVSGAAARDVLTGASFDIRAAVVVIAGGPGSERLVDQVTGRDTIARSWRPVKGMNVLVPRLAGDLAVGVPVSPAGGDAGDGRGARLIFVTPWRGLSLVGTAYYPQAGGARECFATDDEISRFVAQINAACPNASLTTDDVLAVQTGVMPVANPRPGDRDVRFLEHHRVVDHARTHRLAGLISLVAIKYTTARLAARDVVNLVFRKVDTPAPACVTACKPLFGGETGPFASFVLRQVERWSDIVAPQAIRRLARLYGTALPDVLGLCPKRGGSIADETDVLRAETLHAARHEMAAKLGDLVFRRTDLASRGHPGAGPIAEAAEVMAGELGWDADRTEAEIGEVTAELRLRRCVDGTAGAPGTVGGHPVSDRGSVVTALDGS